MVYFLKSLIGCGFWLLVVAKIQIWAKNFVFKANSQKLTANSYKNSRGSVTTPVTAAAAATNGEAKSVLAPGP
jgi:hypothetical protein